MRTNSHPTKVRHDLIVLKRRLFQAGLFLGQTILALKLNRRQKRPIQRILLIRLQRLGDVLMAKPVVDALSRKHPEARIDLLTGADALKLKSVFGRTVSHWYIHNSRKYHEKHSSRSQRQALLNSIGPYDLVVDCDGDGYSLRLCNEINPGRYLPRGWRRWREVRGRADKTTCQLELLLRVAELEGPAPCLPVRQDHARRREIEIHPFAGASIKYPGRLFYEELIWQMKEQFKAYDVVLTGYGWERSEVRSLARSTDTRVYESPTDRLHENFRRSVALVVCPDTFTMHFAAFLGTPVIALFGPQTPERFADAYPGVDPVYHRLACSPCVYNNFNLDFCPYNNECTRLITVQEVIEKARAILN